MDVTRDLGRCLSEREAAEVLGVSPVTLVRLRRRQAIEHLRISRRVVYRPEHLRSFMESARVGRLAA